jgi:hypothetical protein
MQILRALASLRLRVKSVGMRCGLLDNFWHHEQAVGRGGRIAEGFLVGDRRLNFIKARHVDERYGVRGRFDPAHVQFLQLCDVAEDVVELLAKPLFFGGGKRQARQVRDVFDIDFRCGHGRRLKFKVQSSKFKVQ